MKRGDLIWADLGKPVGSEAAGRRPAVIVSHNGTNQAVETNGGGVVTIVPVTSNTALVRPFQVLLPAAACGLRADSKAQCEQVRAVDVKRIGATIGQVPGPLIDELDEALRFQLGL